jgi:hypothetical protein
MNFIQHCFICHPLNSIVLEEDEMKLEQLQLRLDLVHNDVGTVNRRLIGTVNHTLLLSYLHIYWTKFCPHQLSSFSISGGGGGSHLIHRP